MNHANKPSRIPLTRTEQKCLAYVAEGWNDEQIGKALVLSRSEVESVLTITVSKLGVENRAAAVAKAARLGLFDNSINISPDRFGGDYSRSS